MSLDYDKWDLFAVDQRGFKIYCNEEQLDFIYEYHPELINFWAEEGDFAKAIKESVGIFQSTHGKEFNVYYLKKPGSVQDNRTELKIVVKFNHEDEGILYMAQPCSKRPDGEKMIWPTTSP